MKSFPYLRTPDHLRSLSFGLGILGPLFALANLAQLLNLIGSQKPLPPIPGIIALAACTVMLPIYSVIALRDILLRNRDGNACDIAVLLVFLSYGFKDARFSLSNFERWEALLLLLVAVDPAARLADWVWERTRTLVREHRARAG